MKILVVDDNHEITFVIKAILQQEQYHVRTADSAMDGYIMYLQFQPDLVITDIHMPRNNGFEMMEAIRIHNSEIKTIYMSADPFSFGTRLRVEKEIYGTDLLNKPFTREDLLQTLSSMQN